MSSLNINDPYGQITLPYQPHLERTDPILFQQKQTVFLPSTPQAGSSQNKIMRSSPASNSRRLSKEEVLSIVHRCKKWLIGGSLVSFGILTTLVVGHTVGTTSARTTSATNNQTMPALNATATSSSSDGGFFQQQGGEYGGYGFGKNNSWQPSVSSSSAS